MINSMSFIGSLWNSIFCLRSMTGAIILDTGPWGVSQKHPKLSRGRMRTLSLSIIAVTLLFSFPYLPQDNYLREF